MHTHTHINTYTYTHTHIHTYTHTYTHAHTYRHTYTYTTSTLYHCITKASLANGAINRKVRGQR
jgi:hypothetical protein